MVFDLRAKSLMRFASTLNVVFTFLLHLLKQVLGFYVCIPWTTVNPSYDITHLQCYGKQSISKTMQLIPLSGINFLHYRY